jgi:methionine-rich copper-binding protein CopC
MKKLFLVLVTVLIFQSAVSAHAFPDHADPAVGSTVEKPPTELKIWFTQEIEPAFSTITVSSDDGKQIDKKDSHLDDKDKMLLIVSLPALAGGTYKVHWHVVCTDTHTTQGDFKFTVKAKE